MVLGLSRATKQCPINNSAARRMARVEDLPGSGITVAELTAEMVRMLTAPRQPSSPLGDVINVTASPREDAGLDGAGQA
jgi:hypothetical protein